MKKEQLTYNPDTGIFIWNPRSRVLFKSDREYKWWNAMYADREAGYVDHDGYVRIRIDGLPVMAHRLAWLYARGQEPVNSIYHINGIRSDNRIENLTEVK